MGSPLYALEINDEKLRKISKRLSKKDGALGALAVEALTGVAWQDAGKVTVEVYNRST